MDDQLISLAMTLGDGMVLSADLVALGVTSHQTAAMVTKGALIKLRRGIYLPAQLWHVAGPSERYRLSIRAWLMTTSHSPVISHYSAAAFHGLPMVGSWPGMVHVSLPGAAGGASASGVVSHTSERPLQVVSMDGVAMTSLIQTLVDIAATATHSVSVPMIDDALRRMPKMVSREALLDELQLNPPRSGLRAASRAVELSNSKAANAGESYSRVRMAELGFVLPELQQTFIVRGRRYEVDFWWPEQGIVGEFDGRQKYERSELMSGRTSVQVVWDEKLREDAIRSHSKVRSFARWTWADVRAAAEFESLLEGARVPRLPLARARATRPRS